MAIVQVSRIQHRKGLQQDLPQLASAEFGWALDTRKLYIGNGTVAEGAASEGITEILTQYSDLLNIAGAYVFRGAQSGYTSQTGVSALAPIQRSLQLKSDDVVNARDFGATGDGTTDDTAALQRAIDQIYFGSFSKNQSRLRRVINIPAGTYVLTDSLKLNSYTILRGEGKDRTILQQTNSLYPVFQLKDDLGQIDDAYGSGSVPTALNITVEYMTVNSNSTHELVYLDTCQGVSFNSVKFSGFTSSFITNGGSQDKQNALRAVPTTTGGSVQDLTFSDCEVTGCTQGLLLDAINVRIIGSKFSYVNNGVWVDNTLSNATTNNIKVIGCTFDNIARSGIKVTTAGGEPINFTSSGNHFGTVGFGLPVTTPTYSPIDFSASDCISIGDTFLQTDANAATVPAISISNDRNIAMQANVGLTLGRMTYGTSTTITIPDSSDGHATDANTGVTFSTTPGNYKIDYLLNRGVAYRNGVLTVMVNNSGGTQRIEFQDDYNEFPEPADITSNLGATGTTMQVRTDGSGTATWYANANAFVSATATTITYAITTFK